MRSKKLRAALFLVAAFLFAQTMQAAPNPKAPKQFIRLDDDVNRFMGNKFEDFHSAVNAVPSNPIVNILIFSNGGRVSDMKRIIYQMNEMKREGYKFRCLAIAAYSAAFMIWLECDERFVLPDSKLMFHYAYSSVEEASHVTIEEAFTTLADLTLLKAEFNEAFKKHLGPHLTDIQIERAAIDSRYWGGYEFCNDKPGLCKVLQRTNSFEGFKND